MAAPMSGGVLLGAGAARDREDLARVDTSRFATAPITPAHLAVRVSKRASGLQWVYPLHLQYLNEKLTEVLLSPRSRFVLVELPVRHGKSDYVSSYVTAWHKGTWPEKHVMLNSYADRLVKKHSRRARRILTEFGPDLFDVEVSRENRSVIQWELAGSGGTFTASTTGGQITGGGGDLIVIDDPVKDAKAAHSLHQRDELWEWYTETLRSRLEPGGKIILVMSRWHEDDLAGRLLLNSLDDPAADQWERIRLPAIAEPAPGEIVEDLAEWRDPIGRAYGEPLWPQRWGVRTLARTKASVGPLAWEANYQQRPTAREGDLFKAQAWKKIGALPAEAAKLCARRFDLADGGTDFAATALVALAPDGSTYIVDVARRPGSIGGQKVREFFRSEAEADRDGNTGWRPAMRPKLRIEQEPGSAGKTVADQYVRDVFAGFTAEGKTTSGSKELNAEPLASQQQAGNVYLVGRGIDAEGNPIPAPWWSVFIEEARTFPRGLNDDMIDVAGQAYNDCVEYRKHRSKARARSAADVHV